MEGGGREGGGGRWEEKSHHSRSHTFSFTISLNGFCGDSVQTNNNTVSFKTWKSSTSVSVMLL